MTGYPLQRLMVDLENWDQEMLPTKDEIMDYAHELWKTAQQFEKELQTSMKGHELEMQRLKFSSSSTIEWLKHKSSTYILSLEEALRMTKEKYMQEIEQLTMKISEYESNYLRQQVQDPELTNILTQDIADIIDVGELQNIIRKLQNAGLALKSENTQYVQTI